MDTKAKLASISAYGPARATIAGSPLSPEELHDVEAYWHAFWAEPAVRAAKG